VRRITLYGFAGRSDRVDGRGGSGSVARVPAQQISRRVLLGAATAALLSGCDDEPAPPPRTPGTADPDPNPPTGGTGGAAPADPGDDRLVANAVASGRELAGAYAALVARHPDTGPPTAPLREHLREHLTALGHDGGPTTQATAARTRQRAVRTVMTAERAASSARLADAVAAASGDLARALASIAASHAQHALVLEEL